MDFVFLSILYDHYEKLLSNKQQAYFIDYYFNNLSLSEMSDNYQVSRNAIHKQLKVIEAKLIDYEKKLKLCAKSKKAKVLINNIKDEKLRKKLADLF